MEFAFTRAITAVVLLLAAHVPAGAQDCDNQLIEGRYAFTIEGQKLGPAGTLIGPQVGVAMTTFDGRGGLTQTDTITINGEVVADFTHPTAGGTYTIHSDCTGTFTINFRDGRPPATVNLVVTNNGNEIDTVIVSRGGPGVLATRSIGKRTTPRGND
jgi:hypothetical protein